MRFLKFMLLVSVLVSHLAFAVEGKDLTYFKYQGKYGYIDRSARVVIAPKYHNAWRFASNGLAQVSFDGKSGFVNTQGKEV